MTVAVLDTGVDATHPDLAGTVVAAETFVDDERGTSDVLGHGTHVASIIAGTGAASQGQLRGVAPDATLISGRVCLGFFCPMSAILDGIEWAVVARGARIVNLSIGGTDTPEEDPLEAAINQLSVERGTLFVVPAGNFGFSPGSIDSPGSAEAALTVGAVERDDRRAVFSGQGPRAGDRGLKPDLTAPGVGIVAAKAAGASIGEPVGDSYLRLDGTSMAVPHVAGAAALLLQQHPDWTGPQLKAALLGAAAPNPALGAFEQGAGRLDLDRATRQRVLATPASLSLGLATFPHDDDPILRRTVRYDNLGANPVVLSLDAALTAPGGNAAPADSIAIAPSTLTVPPGGSAEVVVIVDTSKPGPNGLYGGALTATGDGVRVVTPLGVDRDIEAYDLTLSVLDAAGDPVPANVLILGVADAGTTAGDVRLSGSITEPTTLHLPRGRYMVHTFDFNNSADLSTQVSAAWTFRSKHAEGELEILPIPALRFSPALDRHNQTRARILVLPVRVERVAGAPTPRIARVQVDASFDDGASWVQVPLLVLGDDAVGFIVHPHGATHVSLRGSAADVAGNQVEQTIIRAYGLAPR